MYYNFVKMLGFKYFIFSLFLWLSLTTPPQLHGVPIIFDSQAELITTSSDINHQALIVDNQLETHRANWSFKTLKIPYTHFLESIETYNAQKYDYKLLYIEIGDAIPLNLTIRKLIFPFHYFT